MTERFIAILEEKISKCVDLELLKRLNYILSVCKKPIVKHYLNLNTESIEGEIWKSISNFEGYYEISNKGRVKSLKRKTIRNQPVLEKILRQNKWGADPHLRVALKKDGYKVFGVHQLTASHFIENCLSKPMVNHINGIPFCNELWNLEWATAAENNKHAHQIGANFAQKEEGHRFAKLKKEDVLYIISCNKLPTELALLYNISGSSLTGIKHLPSQQKTA